MSNVFICHHSKDVPKLRDLLDKLKAKGYTVKSSSLQEDRDNKVVHKGKHVADATVARYIRSAIRWAGTFIVLIGEHTHAELPEVYKRYGTSPIGWNSTDKLGGLIEGKVEPAELPDGTPFLGKIHSMIYIECNK